MRAALIAVRSTWIWHKYIWGMGMVVFIYLCFVLRFSIQMTFFFFFFFLFFSFFFLAAFTSLLRWTCSTVFLHT